MCQKHNESLELFCTIHRNVNEKPGLLLAQLNHQRYIIYNTKRHFYDNIQTFDGIQPTFRHVPPSVGFFSTQTVYIKTRNPK